ncbi:MAG TPA: prephenate dehydratase [Chloroflexota bacterium]|nr:prephenate dehydratase [Chloroflexota bacterium]
MIPPALSIGYQGVPGAYSEEALQAFAPHARRLPHRTLPDLFAALQDRAIDRAFVPIENSHAGSVVDAYDLLLDHAVTIEAEWIHPVHHCLLGLPGAALDDVERVFSHPQALAQTQTYVRSAGFRSEAYYDTAGAAQMVAEEQDRRYAAVAGRLAAEKYGLAVLADGIQTSADNATRFFLLAPEDGQPAEMPGEGEGRTTLVFSVAHRPGALVRALTCFARRGVNLNRLESRPSRRSPWEYMFFTDIEGYASQPQVAAALRELDRLYPPVRILGSYPAAHLPEGVTT